MHCTKNEYRKDFTKNTESTILPNSISESKFLSNVSLVWRLADHTPADGESSEWEGGPGTGPQGAEAGHSTLPALEIAPSDRGKGEPQGECKGLAC